MKDFSDGLLSPDTAEQGERPRGGFWSKLARFWSPEEAPAAEPEPLSDEAAPGESPAQAVSGEAEIPDEVLKVTPALAVEQPAPVEEKFVEEQPVEEQPVEEQPETAAQGPPSPDRAQAKADLAADLAEENATLRAAADKQDKQVDKQQEEPERLSRELEHSRQADAEALEEIRAEVESERKREQEAIQAAQQKFSAEMQEVLARNNQIHSEAEKLRTDLTRMGSELQRVNAERERLQSESDQLRKETAGIRQASQEVPQLKEEVRRLDQELTQARAALDSGRAGDLREAAELTAELVQRDDELKRLNERMAGLEQELSSRGFLVPLSSLDPALQRVLAHMGTAVEAQRIVTELWDRLLEQETRYNAANSAADEATREDTNPNTHEVDMLRKQMAELYQDLIAPITVLSASADLLLMRQDIPQDGLASLEEIRQSAATVRQVIAGMQPISSPGPHKG